MFSRFVCFLERCDGCWQAVAMTVGIISYFRGWNETTVTVMMANAKNVIFDFGGVLVDLRRERCVENLRKLGVFGAEKQIDLYAQDGLFGRLEKGLLTDAQFRDELRKASGRKLADADIDRAWNSILGEIDSCKLDFIRTLRPAHKVYLLSNTNNIHWQYALNHFFDKPGCGIGDCFDAVFLSYRMRLAKPDKEIFFRVLEATGCKPSDTLLVDDSEANCAAAESVGMQTFHVSPDGDWVGKLPVA